MDVEAVARRGGASLPAIEVVAGKVLGRQRPARGTHRRRGPSACTRRARRARGPRCCGPPPRARRGSDDGAAIISLLSRHLEWDSETLEIPFVHDAMGVDNLLRELPVAVSATYTRLGIVADMDDPEGHDRWAQVRDRLRSKGVPAPDAPEPEGTIFPGLGGPSSRIGVWLMPDNRSAGVLEHFLSTLIPPGDPCSSYAEEVTTHARFLGARLAEKDHRKGVIHTWLAWQADPGVPFGVALTKRYLCDDSEEALRFVAWFKKLFLEPTEAPDHPG